LLLAGHGSESSGNENRTQIKESLSEATVEERAAILEPYIRDQVGRVLRIPAAKLDIQRPLNQMGLDSLMAVELKNRIEGDLEVALPTGKLVQDPTIESLVNILLDRLADSSSAPAETAAPSHLGMVEADGALVLGNLVPLKAQGTRLPLYCIHPSGGVVGIYRPLAERIDTERSILGLQARQLTAEARSGVSFQVLASAYTDTIRRQQTTGPYHLLGFSFGGLLAIAIAQNLEELDQEVGFVGLIDCYPNSSDPETRKDLILREIIMQMYRSAERELGIVASRSESALDEESLRLAQLLLSLPEGERVQQLVEWLTTYGLVRKDVPISQVGEYLTMFYFHLRLNDSVDLAPIRAPLHLWWAARSLTGVNQDRGPCRSLTRGALSEEVLEGDHFGIMYPPSVDTLAAQLNLLLRSFR
jgi:thioesterase domain-containing protein